MISRHEILRTRFITQGGEPRQKIESSSTCIQYKDLRGITGRESLAASRVRLAPSEPFDLETGPLLRGELLQLEETAYVFVFTMHHIISDGWSMGILLEEVLTFYKSYSQGAGDPLSPLRIQYKDYVGWEQRLLTSARLQQLESYWRKHFAGGFEPVRLPADQPSTGSKTRRSSRVSFEVAGTVREKLYSLALKYEVTLYSLFLSIFNMFLSKACHQEDITLLVGNSGRNHLDVESLIGYFLRIYGIRNQVKEEQPFVDLLRRVKEVQLAAAEHDEYPFEEILSHLSASGKSTSGPVNVFFQLDNVSREGKGDILNEIEGLQIRSLTTGSEVAKTDLLLYVHEDRERLECMMEYNTDLFSADKIELLKSWLESLLVQVCDNPEQPVGSYVLSTGKEEALYRYLGVSEEVIEQILPLSAVQRDLYLHCRIRPEENTYRLTYYVEAEGHAEASPWEQLFTSVQEELPVLKCLLLIRGEEVYQGIQVKAGIDLTWIDLSAENLKAENTDQRVRALTNVSQRLEEPLVKYYILKLSTDKYVIAISAHHLVFDGHSAQLFFRSLYSIKAGKAPDLSVKSRISFPARYDSSSTKAYWEEKLEVSPLQGNVAGKKAGRDFVRHSFNIGREQSNAIRTLCDRQGVSVPMYFKALYGLMINYYCRAEESFVVREILNARLPGMEEEAGCHYLSVPVVIEKEALKGDKDIAGYLQYVRGQKKELKQHIYLSVFLQNQLLGKEALRFYYNYYTFSKVETPAGGKRIHDIVHYQKEEVHFLGEETEEGFLLRLHYHEEHFSGQLFLERLVEVSGR